MVDLNAVLKTVNSIRTNCLNLPALSTLPQGRQDTANACPLANALGAAVFPDCMLFQGIDGKFDEKLDEINQKVDNQQIQLDNQQSILDQIMTFLKSIFNWT